MTDKGKHGNDLHVFEGLDFAGQAKSFNGLMRNLEHTVKAHVRRSRDEGRNHEQTLSKCINQINGVLDRLQSEYHIN